LQRLFLGALFFIIFYYRKSLFGFCSLGSSFLKLSFSLRSSSSKLLTCKAKAAIVILFSLLDERKRRLYTGFESLKWGHGGDRRIASLLDLVEKTVARGRLELLDEDLDYEGVRKPGAAAGR
jgi:hypothetical protein